MSRTHTRTRQRAPRRFVVPPPVSILEAGKLEPLVAVFGYHYTVDFGPGVRPRIHTVFKDRKCRCELSADCPAVQAVADHLRADGTRAPDCPANYWETVPTECPLCGGPVKGDHTLDTRRNGCGWRCEADGGHFWEAKLGEAKAWFFRNSGAPIDMPPYGYLPECNR